MRRVVWWLPPSRPFMIEREFRSVLADDPSLLRGEHANDTTRLAVDPRPTRQAYGSRDSPFLVWKRHQSRTRMERYFIERPEVRSRRRTRQPEYGR